MQTPKLVIVVRIGAAHKALKKPWTKERVIEIVDHMGLEGSSDPDFLKLMRGLTDKTDIGDLDHAELEKVAQALIAAAHHKMGGGCG
tara:strand:- start:4 stop:264 length:261 start_codon:yes stop_codon:yes gene_type:complete